MSLTKREEKNKKKDLYLKAVNLNPDLYKKLPKFRDVNVVLEAAKEDYRVIYHVADSLIKTNPEIGFICYNANKIFYIHEHPEEFLRLQTEYFRHKDFIDVAMGAVKQSLKNSVEKEEGVSDKYLETVKKLLDAINDKTIREYEKVQLEKEQEEVKRKEENEKSLRMKENKEKLIELIEGFDSKKKNMTEGDDPEQPYKIKLVEDDETEEEDESKVLRDIDDGRNI